MATRANYGGGREKHTRVAKKEKKGTKRGKGTHARAPPTPWELDRSQRVGKKKKEKLKRGREHAERAPDVRKGDRLDAWKLYPWRGSNCTLTSEERKSGKPDTHKS